MRVSDLLVSLTPPSLNPFQYSPLPFFRRRQPSLLTNHGIHNPLPYLVFEDRQAKGKNWWTTVGCVTERSSGNRRAPDATSSHVNMTPQACQTLCAGYPPKVTCPSSLTRLSSLTHRLTQQQQRPMTTASQALAKTIQPPLQASAAASHAHSSPMNKSSSPALTGSRSS